MEELLKLPEFSWEEIQKHKDAQSCWCVFYGLVYDLTKFMKYHPGGHHVILEAAGTATSVVLCVQTVAAHP